MMRDKSTLFIKKTRSTVLMRKVDDKRLSGEEREREGDNYQDKKY